MLRQFQSVAADEGSGSGLHADVPEVEFSRNGRLVALDDLTAQMDEDLGNIDLYRADLITGAAK